MVRDMGEEDQRSIDRTGMQMRWMAQKRRRERERSKRRRKRAQELKREVLSKHGRIYSLS